MARKKYTHNHEDDGTTFVEGCEACDAELRAEQRWEREAEGLAQLMVGMKGQLETFLRDSLAAHEANFLAPQPVCQCGVEFHGYQGWVDHIATGSQQPRLYVGDEPLVIEREQLPEIDMCEQANRAAARYGIDPDAPLTQGVWLKYVAGQMGVSLSYFRKTYLSADERAIPNNAHLGDTFRDAFGRQMRRMGDLVKGAK